MLIWDKPMNIIRQANRNKEGHHSTPKNRRKVGACLAIRYWSRQLRPGRIIGSQTPRPSTILTLS